VPAAPAPVPAKVPKKKKGAEAYGRSALYDDEEDSPEVAAAAAAAQARQAKAEAARASAEKLERVIVMQQHDLETLQAQVKYDEVQINKLTAKLEESRRRERAAIDGQTDFQTRRIANELERLNELVEQQQRDLASKDEELQITIARWGERETELAHMQSGLAVLGAEDLEGQAKELAEAREDNCRLEEELRLALEDKGILERQLADCQAQVLEYQARLLGWGGGGGGGGGAGAEAGHGGEDGDDGDDDSSRRHLPYEVAEYHAPVIQVVNDGRRRIQQSQEPYDAAGYGYTTPYEYHGAED
jgi:hypothetical protein